MEITCFWPTTHCTLPFFLLLFTGQHIMASHELLWFLPNWQNTCWCLLTDACFICILSHEMCLNQYLVSYFLREWVNIKHHKQNNRNTKCTKLMNNDYVSDELHLYRYSGCRLSIQTKLIGLFCNTVAFFIFKIAIFVQHSVKQMCVKF